MSTAAVPTAADVPLRFGTDEGFTALREFLGAAGYSEERIRHRLTVETMYDIRTVREGRPRRPVRDALDLLVHLFLDAEPATRRRAKKLLGDGLELLQAAGLVTDAPRECVKATVFLYPTRGYWIASDLYTNPRASRHGLASDAVYAAITPNTRMFLTGLPETPCGDVLDLCSGTGIAALVAAREATHATAIDVTVRSTLFCEFNARLNGVYNVTALTGDLYAPVAGQRFERIFAHPPYIPTPRQKYIYRDGGEDGEMVTRRVIAGVPDHLLPGGIFYCCCAATDRKGAPLEQRVRAMLGEQADAFDVFVTTSSVHEPNAYYAEQMAKNRTAPPEARAILRGLRALDVEQIAYGWIIIIRHEEPRSALTLRRRIGRENVLAATLHVRAWEQRAGDEAALQQLLDSKPRVSDHARLQVRQQMRERRWAIEACAITTDSPFALTLEPSPEALGFVNRCDGTRSVREHIALLRQNGAVPDTVNDLEFAELVRSMLSGGFLTVDT